MDIHIFLLSPWLWFTLAVLFLLMEVGHFSLVTIWFALAAFAMIFVNGLLSLIDISIPMKFQLGIFLIISAVLLIFTRPVAVNKLKVGNVKTNFNELIGQNVLITKKIIKHEKGEGKIKGKVWTVISENGEEIAEGTEGEILRIEGVTLIVRVK